MKQGWRIDAAWLKYIKKRANLSGSERRSVHISSGLAAIDNGAKQREADSERGLLAPAGGGAGGRQALGQAVQRGPGGGWPAGGWQALADAVHEVRGLQQAGQLRGGQAGQGAFDEALVLALYARFA